MKRRILVVDVGGTSVKLLRSRRDEREFPSGPRMGPEQFVARFAENVRGWKFDMTSIGFPAPVRKGRIVGNPKHLGKGWIGFNFGRVLGTPVRLINDAAMQALGSYGGDGGWSVLGVGTWWCVHLGWVTRPMRQEPSCVFDAQIDRYQNQVRLFRQRSVGGGYKEK